jgi:hypothetical protein
MGRGISEVTVLLVVFGAVLVAKGIGLLTAQ